MQKWLNTRKIKVGSLGIPLSNWSVSFGNRKKKTHRLCMLKNNNNSISYKWTFSHYKTQNIEIRVCLPPWEEIVMNFKWLLFLKHFPMIHTSATPHILPPPWTYLPIYLEWYPLTFPPSVRLVTIMILADFSCHAILHMSFTDAMFGPWHAMYPLPFL